jgi:hypothetical protein
MIAAARDEPHSLEALSQREGCVWHAPLSFGESKLRTLPG